MTVFHDRKDRLFETGMAYFPERPSLQNFLKNLFRIAETALAVTCGID